MRPELDRLDQSGPHPSGLQERLRPEVRGAIEQVKVMFQANVRHRHLVRSSPSLGQCCCRKRYGAMGPVHVLDPAPSPQGLLQDQHAVPVV